MTDLADQIHQLRTRVDAVQRARARAELERDAAQSAVQTAKLRLKQEFDVESVEDGLRLLSSLESEVKLRIEETVSALDSIGE